MNDKTRGHIERLKKQFSGQAVGILMQTKNGWTAQRGAVKREFPREEEALTFLKSCQPIIFIDV